jgi:hypothetical protein
LVAHGGRAKSETGYRFSLMLKPDSSAVFHRLTSELRVRPCIFFLKPGCILIKT